MRTYRALLLMIAVAAATAPSAALAGKGGGTAASPIRVENLGRPAGSIGATAYAINEAGTVVVGAAAWDMVYTYPGASLAARWTRTGSAASWLAEDVRSLLPPSHWSWGLQANDARTATFRVNGHDDGRYYAFALDASDVPFNLGVDVSPSALAADDSMVGVGYGAAYGHREVPLYWSSPSASQEALPLDGADAGQALFFDGAAIVGTVDDGAVRSLARWSGGPGAWSLVRIVQLPPSSTPTGFNASGRLSLWLCDPSPCNTSQGQTYAKAAFWDPPYSGRPTYLPTLYGPKSYARAVTEDGTVVGEVVASNGVDMLPVAWITTTQVTPLPLLSGGKSGAAHGANSYRQVVGYVEVTVKGKKTRHAALWTLP